MTEAPNIRFACAACGKTLTVGSQHAGKRAKCSACGTIVQVPAAPSNQSAVPICSGPSNEAMIGVSEPICPYCNHPLEKMPGRKKNCPSCGNDIFVRTRPQDKRKILVRRDQLAAVEEQWAIANGTHVEFLAARQRRENCRAQLQARFGREPSENDVQWALLNDDILACIQKSNWGLYRNTRREMGEILCKEKRLAQALDFMLEVCYLDLNGPRNCCGVLDPAILAEHPAFDPTEGDLAPGVVGSVQELVESLHQMPQETESRFVTVSSRLAKSLGMPLSPEDAWRTLAPQISGIRDG